MSESEGRGGHNKISRDELLRALADLRDKLGEVPRLKDWREQGDYSAKALYNEFDSWNAALDALDMEKHHVVNKERLTLKCENPACSETVEKTPGVADRSEYHYCSQDCHYAHKSERYGGDGNPVSTLKSVKCDVCGDVFQRGKWARERYKRTYCSDCWGDSKVEMQCDWCGETERVWPSWKRARRFCSKSCTSEWQSETWVGEEHPRSKQGRLPGYYGPNFSHQRLKAIIRDQARCQRCGMTDKESHQRYGESLSAHHETAFREFVEGDEIDYEAANKLENLTPLCRSCHSKVETEQERTDY